MTLQKFFRRKTGRLNSHRSAHHFRVDFIGLLTFAMALALTLLFLTAPSARVEKKDAAEADVADLNRDRTQIEHAPAILTGDAVSNFKRPASPLDISPPAPSPGLPSHLLERRPDVAQLSNKRYRAGLVSYLEVVDSERTALTSQRIATRILGQRLQASVSSL
jgi:outer membrane protein TolC